MKINLLTVKNNKIYNNSWLLIHKDNKKLMKIHSILPTEQIVYYRNVYICLNILSKRKKLRHQIKD